MMQRRLSMTCDQRIFISTLLLLSISWTDAIEDDFLLVTDAVGGKLYQVSLGNGTTQQLPARQQASPGAVDFDPIRRKIYWTDVENAVIKKSDLDEGTSERIIKQLPLDARPSGLAVDPVAKLIFYTHQGATPGLSVMDLEGYTNRILLSGTAENMHEPTTVALDVTRRYVYWLDVKQRKIFRTNYNGTSRATVVQSSAGEMKDFVLYLNSSDTRILWLDAAENKITESSLFGIEQKTVFTQSTGTAQQITSLAADGDHIYLSRKANTNESVILQFHRNTGAKAFGTLKNTTLGDIIVYRKSSYIKGNGSSCSSNNGNCSNLCLPLSDTIVCACQEYRPMLPDNQTCGPSAPIGEGPEMMWLEYNGINSTVRGLSGETSIRLRTRRVTTWSLTMPSRKIEALTGWSARKAFILADNRNSIIELRHFKNITSSTIIKRGVKTVNSMGLDWLTGNLYWTDSDKRWIAMMNIDSKYSRVLIFTGLYRPSAIAVHPKKGLMYWLDRGIDPRIEVATLAGRSRRVLIDRGVLNPLAMVIDYDKDRLYWSDYGTIHYISLEKPSTVKTMASTSIGSFTNIAMSYGYLYATLPFYTVSFVYLIDIRGNKPTALRITIGGSLLGITMVRPEQQPLSKSPCDQNNYGCEHICVSASGGSAECVCADGSVLSANRKNCTTIAAIDIYFAAGSSICPLRTNSELQRDCFFTSSKFRWTALDYDIESRRIIFTETKYRVPSIRQTPVDSLKNNTVLVYGPGNVKGVAHDWVNRLVFWTDAQLGQVWVARMYGEFSRILIRNQQNPHGIVVDPKRSKIYWTVNPTDNRTNPAIYQAYMDGSSISPLYNDKSIGWPTALAIDRVLDRLFYVDTMYNRIMSLPITGTERKAKLEYSSRNYTFYDIDIYQDYIIFTSNRTRPGVYKVKLGTPNGSPIMSWKSPTGQAYDVVVFHEANQPTVSSGPCIVNHGGCEQLCLPGPRGINPCACTDGLIVNGTDCVALPALTDNFMLLADDYRHTIYQVALSRIEQNLDNIRAVEIPSDERPIGLDYDPKERRVYWSDFNKGMIKRSYLDGTKVETIFTHPSDARVDCITIEHVSRLLFYADSRRNLIGVITLTGQNHKILMDDENGGVNNPRSIVLDPVAGYIYWTNRDPTKEKSSIRRAHIDGTNSIDLIKSDLIYPNGLFIDYKKNWLFFVDAHTEKVERVYLGNINASRILIKKVPDPADPFSVLAVDDRVYWTDWWVRGLSRAHVNRIDFKVYHKDFFTGLNEIRVYRKEVLDSQMNASKSKCKDKNGGCSHLCFTVPGWFKCACPDGQEMKDEFNCNGVLTCPREIPNGRIANMSTCHMKPGSVCDYKCDENFRNTSAIKLTCTNSHIWKSPEGDLGSLCTDNFCPLLLTPDNAMETVNCHLNPFPGTKCIFQCLAGFRQVGGSTTRLCASSLTWSGTPLQCEPIPTTTQPTTSQPTTTTTTTKTSTTPPPPTTTTTTSTTTMTSPTGGSLKGGKVGASNTHKVIGGVCAVIVIIIIVVIAVIYIYRRRLQTKARYRHSENMPRTDPTVDMNINSVPKPMVETTTYDVAAGKVNIAFENPTYANPAEVMAAAGGDIQKMPVPDLGPEAVNVSIDDKETGFTNPQYFDKEDPYATIGPFAGRRDPLTEPLYESFPGDVDLAVELEPGMTEKDAKA